MTGGGISLAGIFHCSVHSQIHVKAKNRDVGKSLITMYHDRKPEARRLFGDWDPEATTKRVPESLRLPWQSDPSL